MPDLNERTKIGDTCIETDAVRDDKNGEKFRQELTEHGTAWLLDHGFMEEPGQARVVGMKGGYGVSIQPLKKGIGPIYDFVANEYDCQHKRLANVAITMFVPDEEIK